MIIADTHIHVYPCHDIGKSLTALGDNLARIGGTAIRAAFLAERRDCTFFQTLRDRKGNGLPPGMRIKATSGRECLLVEREGTAPIYLFAGRQIITSERLEVLALVCDASLDDGRSAADTIRSVREAGGVPVLAWSPGKWFFARGKTVSKLLDTFKPGELVIGDTTLRPTWWGKPALMASAEKRGFGLVAGSDPLPFVGEERLCGTYASMLDANLEAGRPVSSARSILLATGRKMTVFGKRSGTVEWIVRQVRNTVGRKK